MKIVVRKLPLIVATVMLLFVGVASATQTAPLTTSTIQELNGQIFRITGNFQFIVSGFHAAGSNATATTCTWNSTTNNGQLAPTCTTSETAGDWVYEVVMQLNNAPKSDTVCTMLVHMNAISGAISFDVPPTATTGTVMNFDFDAGTASWSSPLVFITEVY